MQAVRLPRLVRSARQSDGIRRRTRFVVDDPLSLVRPVNLAKDQSGAGLMKDACTRAVDLAISRSPPRCPDLDQEQPDPDEAAGKTRYLTLSQQRIMDRALRASLRIIA